MTKLDLYLNETDLRHYYDRWLKDPKDEKVLHNLLTVIGSFLDSNNFIKLERLDDEFKIGFDTLTVDSLKINSGTTSLNIGDEILFPFGVTDTVTKEKILNYKFWRGVIKELPPTTGTDMVVMVEKVGSTPNHNNVNYKVLAKNIIIVKQQIIKKDDIDTFKKYIPFPSLRSDYDKINSINSLAIGEFVYFPWCDYDPDTNTDFFKFYRATIKQHKGSAGVEVDYYDGSGTLRRRTLSINDNLLVRGNIK